VRDGSHDRSSAEQWLEARSQRYKFTGFLVLVGLMVALAVAWGVVMYAARASQNPSEAKLADLRNDEKNLNILYERWNNSPNPNRAELGRQILTMAAPLAEQYLAVDPGALSSPKFVIERSQRIAALNAYQAQIYALDKRSVPQAQTHARLEVLNSKFGLEAGERLKSRGDTSDPVVADALTFYLTKPPTEEQVLKWYFANGLAILAATGETISPATGHELLPEAITALRDVIAYFPFDNDPSMNWIAQQEYGTHASAN